MLFQRSVLHDQLQLNSPAREKLYQLIDAMVHGGIQARQNGQPIKLPFRILSDPTRGMHPVETDFDRVALYPDNPAFREDETQQLQLELSQAIARLEQLPIELHRKDKDIIAKNADIDRKDAYIERLVMELEELLDKKNADIQKKDQHIDSLGELFKSSNERVKMLRQRYKEQMDSLREMKKQLNLNAARLAVDSQTRRAA